MKLLVSNDDGIDAPGLRCLVRHLAAFSGSLYVVAPDGERSASGHRITISKEGVTAIAHAVAGATESYACSGTPADCVMLSLASSGIDGGGIFAAPLAAPFDLVLSGINKGHNGGLHVVYSGTVAAAREAAAKHVPALALSLDHYSNDASYEAAAAATCVLVRALQARPDLLAALAGVVLNVNFPGPSVGEPRGFRLTRQSYEATNPGFFPVDSEDGPRRWVNGFGGGTREDKSPGSDTGALAAGYISVTILTILSCIAPHDDIYRSPPPSPLPTPRAVPPGVTEEAATALLEAAAAAVAASPNCTYAAQSVPAECA